MAAKCPNKSHEDWKYSVDKLGEDRTLFMYDALGEDIPTKELVDSLYDPFPTIMYDAVNPEETGENERTGFGYIQNNENVIPRRSNITGRDRRGERNDQTDQTGDIILDKIPDKKSISQTPLQIINAIAAAETKEDIEKILLGYKGVINSKRWEGKLWVKAQDESTLDHITIVNQLVDAINEVYPNLITVDFKEGMSRIKGRGIYEVMVNDYAWQKYLKRNDDSNYKQGILFKQAYQKALQDIKREEINRIKEFIANTSDVTDAYELLDRAEKFFPNISHDHKELFDWIRELKDKNPGLPIQYLTVKEANDKYGDQGKVFDNDLAIYLGLENGIIIIKEAVTNIRYSDQSIFLGTLAHEILHSFTVNPFYKLDDWLVSKGRKAGVYNKLDVMNSNLDDNEKQFVISMIRLFNQAKNRTKEKNSNAYFNIKEFIADGLSHQDTIDELKSMHDKVEKLTFWEKVKQFILKLFGKSTDKDSYHYRLLSSVSDYLYPIDRIKPSTFKYIIDAKKIEDNIFIQKENPTHSKVIKSLQENADAYEALGSKFEGITHMMARLKLGQVAFELLDADTQKELSKYGDIGSLTHFQAEKSFSNVLNNLKSEYNLSDAALADLSKVFEPFKKKGVTILSEVRVSDFKNKMTGIIDLVVIDENGKVHLFDFKTKVGGFEHFDKKFYAKAGQPKFFPFSSYDRASLQLTMYKNMFEDITTLNVETINVIPLKPIVNETTKVIERYVLDKSFNNKDVIQLDKSNWTRLLYTFQTMSMDKEDDKTDITNEQADMLEENARRFEAKIKKDSIPTPEENIFLRIVKSLETRISITKKTGIGDFNAQLRYLTDLIKKAEDKGVNEALSSAVEVAELITRKAYNELDELKKAGVKISVAQLSRLKESVGAFDILDEYMPLLTKKYGLVESLERQYNDKATSEDRKKELGKVIDTLRKLRSAITYKESVKSDYESIGLETIADFIYPFFNRIKVEFRDKYIKEYRELLYDKKRGITKSKEDKDYPVWVNMVEKFDPNITENEYVSSKLNNEKETIDDLTKTTIRKELKKAGQDINKLAAWIDNVLDSPDAVVSAMVKSFVIYDDTARIEIERSRLAMLPIVNEWKEFTKQYGRNYRKAYDIFLERELGKDSLSGYLVTKFHSSLMQEYKSILAIADSLPQETDEQKAYIKSFVDAWKDENAPMNKDAFNLAYLTFVEDLYKDKKISEDDYDKVRYEITKSKGKKKTISQLTISDGSKDLLNNWIKTHAWDFREPADKWINPQWKALSKILDNKDDPRTKMYNLLLDTVHRADDLVPTSTKLGFRLPGVVKQKHERIAEGQNLGDIVKESLNKTLTFKVDDTHRTRTEIQDLEGNAKYFVPVHFTGRVTKEITEDNKKIEVFDEANQSFDLANIYYNYLSSTIEFNWKNNILPEMELFKYLLNNREITKKDSFGNIIYRASKLFKGERTEYDEQTIKGGNIAEQFNTWLLFALYGQAEKDLGTIPGTNIDAGKLVNSINYFTALNLLGLNVVAGVANVSLGEILQWIDAFANEHIGTKEYAKAVTFYTKNMPGMFGDIGSTKPTNIISLLLREFNVLHDSKRRNLTDDRYQDLMQMDSMFFTMELGEHSMQAKFLLAMLEKERAYNKKGEDIGSILDNYEVVDDKLKLKDEVDPSKTKWDNVTRRIFEHKVRRMLTRFHGEYSELGRVAIQQNAIGAMAYMFRKFVVPGFRRRWGGMRYEEGMEQFNEGNYRTMIRFSKQLIKDLKTRKAVVLSRQWATMSDMEKANIIRSIGELVALISVIILSMVAIKFADDDDDKDLFWNFVAYQALRLKSELLFFSSPNQAMKILRSPAASVSIIENTLKLFTQTMGPGWERYERGPWEDHLKIEKTMVDMTIGVRQYFRLRDIGEQISLWKM